MKEILSAILLAVLFTGCASRYTLTLNNGNRITATNKPKLQNGSYIFKDAKGQLTSIPAGRVREVSPANMTSARTSSGYSATPIK